MDEGVIWDIFTRSPPKSIIRFKSLSKRWNSLLSSRNFVKNHLQISQTRKNFFAMTNERLFLPFRIDDKDKFDDGILKVKESIPTPLSGNSEHPVVTMHCDGLLCLYTNLDGNFVVWNPLTKEYKKFQRPYPRFPLVLMGFGYDSVIDDYKIMCVKNQYTSIPVQINSIVVMRLTEGVWNEITNKPPLPFFDFHIRPTFFNGCLYWIHRNQKGFTNDVILCFDLENERMTEEISLNFFDKNTIGHNLDVLEGCLGVVTDYQDRTDISTLKEGKYLVKLFTIPRISYRLCCCIGSKDQVLVANSVGKLYLHNFKDFTCKEIMLKGVKRLCCVFPYSESLVSPNGKYSTF